MWPSPNLAFFPRNPLAQGHPCLPAAVRPARSSAALLALLASALAGGCTEDMPEPEASAQEAPAPGRIDHPQPAQGRAAIAKGALVIDVRTPEEFARGHLPGAQLVPVDELGARQAEVETWAAGDKTRTLVVYCASGKRATRATRMLREAGFENVINGGGLADLQSSPQ